MALNQLQEILYNFNISINNNIIKNLFNKKKKAFQPGYKHYFELKINKGTLIKIGVAREDALIEEVL